MSVFCSADRLRSSKPAPSSRTSDSATSLTSSVESRPARSVRAHRSRAAPAPATTRRARDSATGPSPKITAVASHDRQRESKRRRIEAHVGEARKIGGRERRENRQCPTPRAADRTRRRRRQGPDSRSADRTRSPRRPAPRAVRTAISLWRAAPRTSKRLATFAHAISSTIVTAASNTTSASWTLPTVRS